MDQIVKHDSPSHPSRMRDKARQLLQDIDIGRLPSLPNVLLPLLKTSYNFPDCREQLASYIDKDPALRLRLLAIYQHNAHSTINNEPNQTTSKILQQLDNHTLRNLVITSTAQQYFAEQGSLEQTKFLKNHWQHSLLCAFIAKAIAQQCNYQFPEEAYTAGLLHNIGELALHCAYPDIYTTLNADKDDNIALHDLEEKEFACNHLYLGAELLNLFHADSFLSDAILYHHEDIENIIDAHPLVKIINFTHRLSITDFNNLDNRSDSNIFDHAEQLFNLSRSSIIEIISEANNQLDKCIVDFEIDLDDDCKDEEITRQIQAREKYVRSQLDEQLKFISLLDGLHQQLSRTKNDPDLFDAIQQYTQLLFGIDQNIIFLHKDNEQYIHTIANKNNQHLNDLKIPLKENCSIISDCLLHNENLHSFSHQYNKLSILDQQLLSSAAKQGIICLPLSCQNRTLGVLTLGIDRPQQVTLWKQLPLLKHFCREIAQTIYCRHSENNQANTDWGQFESHIREVIHEVRNPLSIINNYLEILSLKLNSEKQTHSEIQTIKSEISRVDQILQRLKTPNVSHEVSTQVNINTLLTDLTTIFKTSLLASKKIQLELDLDPNLSPVSCNSDSLKQIYTNLVKNAAEALPEKGQIMVYTQGQVNVDGQTYIEISVADNGSGIRPEVLSQLFKPVQTDKGNDHSGIGLSIVKKLVTELNGSISCRSNSRGTNFQILLPTK